MPPGIYSGNKLYKGCTPWNKGKGKPKSKCLTCNKVLSSWRSKYCSVHKGALVTKSLIGKKFSLERRKNLRLAHLGLPSGSKGKHWKLSNEAKERMRQRMLQYWMTHKKPRKRRDERNDSAYHEWVEICKKRDKCCKLKDENCGGYLVVHHIKSWKEYPLLRYEKLNGITLCQAHHPIRRAEEKRLAPILQKLVETSALI